MKPGYSFFAAWGVACFAWGVLGALACGSSSAPASPALRRDQVECLLARQGQLMACVDPNKSAAAQDACIAGVSLDCHDAGPPPATDGSARD